MLSVLEESFIFRKVFVLVRRSAELTLKPLGSSPYKKDKSLDLLYLINSLKGRGFNTYKPKTQSMPGFTPSRIA